MRDYNIIKTYICTNSRNILNWKIKPYIIYIDIDPTVYGINLLKIV